jgi:hypothetical protein
VKTLIFGLSLIVWGLVSGVSHADPYDQLAWEPAHPGFETSRDQPAPNLSLVAFRHFFRLKPPADFRLMLKECGIPAEEWNSNTQQAPNQTIPARMPLYHGGHLFRYKLANEAHVYVWTSEDDGYVMRADYFSTSGRVQPLYYEPL